MLIGENDALQAGSYIKDVTEADFLAEVVEKSMEVPVVVDFWAPWCGPCKTLGPALEAEVAKTKGRVVMAKINIDENQMIAGQLRVQSIPTVYAFYKGQPVDAFQGALPQSQIKQFIDKLTALSGDDGGLAEAIAAAEMMLDEGAYDDAVETFRAIIGEEAENSDAWGGLIRSLLAGGHFEEAKQTLDKVPSAISGSPAVDAARAQIQLAEQAANVGPLDSLREKIEADSNDLQARFDYATALHAGGQIEEAVDQLLEAFRIDRDWNDGAAKSQLITIFEALKQEDPIVKKGRRRLSSLIFT